MSSTIPPILILAWRRPLSLERVIDALRIHSPPLYVACDGPSDNRPGEAAKVSATREVIRKSIDWPCEVHHLFSDKNLGCRLGVTRAINWFFENVDEGIILEDDCIPHPDFFPYCSRLLNQYRNDMRIWCISGNNFQDYQWHGDGDYFFSQIPMSWGWATWRSRWSHFDSELSKWPLVKQSGFLLSTIQDPVMRSYWSRVWDTLYTSDYPDSWAYRWAFTCVVERGLTAIPKVNLVENIGFDSDATHTFDSSLMRSSQSPGSKFKQDPSFVASILANDLAIFNIHFNGKWLRFPFSIAKILLKVFRFPLAIYRKYFF